jgi:hypothetical protein
MKIYESALLQRNNEEPVQIPFPIKSADKGNRPYLEVVMIQPVTVVMQCHRL